METLEIAKTESSIITEAPLKKTGLTALFDSVDNIDRKLYGKKMRYFIWLSLLVLIVAPLLDGLFKDSRDIITFTSTLCLLVFVIVVTLAWISAWRDDTGNWTLKRAMARLGTYSEILKNTASRTKTTSGDETLYKLGIFLFIGSLCWKALHNLSVFVRKPIEAVFSTRLVHARNFEHFTNTYWWVPLVAGFGILYYLYKQNPMILARIKSELRQLFGGKASSDNKYGTQLVKMESFSSSGLVLNARQDEHILALSAVNESPLFKDFVSSIQQWRPHTSESEYDYQEKLIRHLSRTMPDAEIESEFPVGEKAAGDNGRADIVINGTILIEMKSDSRKSAIDRAEGQISRYVRAWNDRGPVILLLCDYNYERAKSAFMPVMENFARQQKPVMTIVAKPI